MTWRYPDLIILGTMKSGTTTLWRRLGQHPEVALSDVKEPNAFSTAWSDDLGWYRNLYADLPADRVTVDASVSYASPDHAAAVAERLDATLPTTPLVVLVRHPVDRLRAHYLHEVQRGRERRPFPEVIDGNSPYVRCSRYHTCLRPFLHGPLAPNLLAVRTDDLDDPAAWCHILEHARLSASPIPPTVANIGVSKEPFTRLGTALWQKGLLQRAGRLPAPIRRLGRGAMIRPSKRADGLVASAAADVPDALRDDLLDEARRAGAEAGFDASSWA